MQISATAPRILVAGVLSTDGVSQLYRTVFDSRRADRRIGTARARRHVPWLSDVGMPVPPQWGQAKPAGHSNIVEVIYAEAKLAIHVNFVSQPPRF
eukprot:scaffold2799_cov408-Prasinococcus_capsulatus_cf.AAC.27